VTDADELRNLLQRYARAADDRDIEALAAVFDPDATIDGARGSLKLDARLDTMRGPRAFPTSMHVLGVPLIELAEGNETGILDTYAVVYQLGDPEDGPDDLTLGVRYVDDVSRVDGSWRIRHRTATTLWMR
jgi:hypothetical protein